MSAWHVMSHSDHHLPSSPSKFLGFPSYWRSNSAFKDICGHWSVRSFSSATSAAVGEKFEEGSEEHLEGSGSRTCSLKGARRARKNLLAPKLAPFLSFQSPPDKVGHFGTSTTDRSHAPHAPDQISVVLGHGFPATFSVFLYKNINVNILR